MKLSFFKFLISCYCITLTTLVFAEPSSSESNFDVNNSNDNLEPNYPGEIKETKNGKQIKLWSTKGPVAVSQASEPFRTQKTIPANAFINVDGTQQGVIRSQIQNQHRNSDKSLPLE